MGTYLSTPVTEKCEESGESLDCPSTPVAWGVVDMQGWRKSMEDAHIAQTDLKVPLHHFDETASENVDGKVFGVFDGHGGPEVARFCQLYLVDVLTKTPTWQEEHHADQAASHPEQTDIGRALISAYHDIDVLIDNVNYMDELMELRYNKPNTRERRTLKKIESAPEEKAEAEATTADQSPTLKKTVPMASEATESEASTTDATSNDTNDDDSTDVVGKEEAAKEDQDMDEDPQESSEATEQADGANNGRVGSLFQKFLNMNASQQNAPNRKLSTEQPSVVEGGRLVCNLPDHPIPAGATAIVAVIIGRTLTVANAGDSRGVLCKKGGETYALSMDHKPQDSREIDRIQKAGGFVNQFGRVNGNLNLSRSIGDLKYKQSGTRAPSEQMITAEPDISQIALDPEDEFVILGCDGIWDCLTNEQAVEFVRSRIDKKYPTQIGTEMLDQIISHDPRVTQGIGGDNMTIMIIDLQPKTRPYRNGVEPEPTAEPPNKGQASIMQVDDEEYSA